MRIRIAVPEEHVDPNVVNAALEAVTRLDESLIRTGQSPTSDDLVRQGAKWRPEPPGDEHFDHGGTIAQRGWGDCDDWAPLHAATLRATGRDPGARAIVVPSGPSTYHAMVQRGDGSVEQGQADISVRAGMHDKNISVVGGEGEMHAWICDPHDGRIYEGAMLPTVGPLSLHCGPQVTVRGCKVVGAFYEGRCDLPISGSPLVGAKHRRRHRVRGAVPYSLSCMAAGRTPRDAVSMAIRGAVLCGDASDMSTSLDRYKLVALQSTMAGMHPAQVGPALAGVMCHDLASAQERGGPDMQTALAGLAAGLAHETRRGVAPTFEGVCGAIAQGAAQAHETIAPALGRPDFYARL